MKRLLVICLSFLTLAVAISARAQVVPSASGRRLRVFVGGEGSVFQPDYAGQGIAEVGPNRLYGVGAFADADFTRWVQIEMEGRWLVWNQYAGINERTYSIGPRIPVGTFKGFTPYGKFLIGIGSGSFLNGRTTAFTYGGGVDYKLGRKLNLRIIDFEYQDWRVTPTLYPYGGSIGISYRIF